MGKIHFLKPEDFERSGNKAKKTKNYRQLCLFLAVAFILENLFIVWSLYKHH